MKHIIKVYLDEFYFVVFDIYFCKKWYVFQNDTPVAIIWCTCRGSKLILKLRVKA